MLITSFDVMRSGMSYEDYNIFRSTLAPASGFQSAQFRYLELYCTRLENLINQRGKERLPKNPTMEDMFENIYWKDAVFLLYPASFQRWKICSKTSIGKMLDIIEKLARKH